MKKLLVITILAVSGLFWVNAYAGEYGILNSWEDLARIVKKTREFVRDQSIIGNSANMTVWFCQRRNGKIIYSIASESSSLAHHMQLPHLVLEPLADHKCGGCATTPVGKNIQTDGGPGRIVEGEY